MGKINDTGIITICNHCNYIWLYSGSNQITSCPKCGWRIRIYYENSDCLDKSIYSIKKYDNIPYYFRTFFVLIDKLCLTDVDLQKIQNRIKKQSNKNRITSEEYKQKLKELRKDYKYACFFYYGRGEIKCSYPGCNVTDIDMLTIDHINGGGGKMRRENKLGVGGLPLYKYLIENHFPEGYRVLCFNHNYLEGVIHKQS